MTKKELLTALEYLDDDAKIKIISLKNSGWQDIVATSYYANEYCNSKKEVKIDGIVLEIKGWQT